MSTNDSGTASERKFRLLVVDDDAVELGEFLAIHRELLAERVDFLLIVRELGAFDPQALRDLRRGLDVARFHRQAFLGVLALHDRRGERAAGLATVEAKLLALGAAVAFFGSIGFALASEFMDGSLKTPEEVETELRLPVLEVIPYSRRPLMMNQAR